MKWTPAFFVHNFKKKIPIYFRASAGVCSTYQRTLMGESKGGKHLEDIGVDFILISKCRYSRNPLIRTLVIQIGLAPLG